MRIFVGFGFNERDRWVKERVFPLVAAFDGEAVDGAEIPGEVITDAVRKRIASCDAVIGFTTRRDPIGGNAWTTHRWVTDEISHAIALEKPTVEVREVGADDQGGIVGDRQRLTYDEARRDELLVELAKLLGRWRRELNPIRLQVLPPDCAYDLVPLHRKVKCQYRLLDDAGAESGPFPATLRPIKGGLFVEVRGVTVESLIQLEVEYQGRTWVSGFESIDSVGVMLQRGS